MNIDEKFQSAFQYHHDGTLQQAENLYGEILEVQPDHIPALHLLGFVFYQGTFSYGQTYLAFAL